MFRGVQCSVCGSEIFSFGWSRLARGGARILPSVTPIPSTNRCTILLACVFYYDYVLIAHDTILCTMFCMYTDYYILLCLVVCMLVTRIPFTIHCTFLLFCVLFTHIIFCILHSVTPFTLFSTAKCSWRTSFLSRIRLSRPSTSAFESVAVLIQSVMAFFSLVFQKLLRVSRNLFRSARTS